MSPLLQGSIGASRNRLGDMLLHMMSRFELELPAPTVRTRVTLGEGALADLARVADGAAHVLMVTDANVVRTPWCEGALEALQAGPRTRHARSVLEPGEVNKDLRAVARLWAEWSAAGASRDSLVLAVGGGVVTDIAGFAAATFMRGLPWIAVPTTLLGMADAALGGKTGINTPAGKNLAGAVHHPRAMIADTRALSTLDPKTTVEGWAEMLKAGLIGDAELFADLERAAESQHPLDACTTASALARSLRVKAQVVAADPRENSRREILNFGHAVAHALETASGHALGHGSAVSIGLVAEAQLAVARGRLPADLPARIAMTCARLGLPVRVPRSIDEAAFRHALRADKKRRSGELRVSLPTALGQHDASPGVTVPEDELIASLAWD